jgi:nicotinate phosphoribosyltransferase
VGRQGHGHGAAWSDRRVRRRHGEGGGVAFSKKYGETTNVSVLVDFDNDCAATACRVATRCGVAWLPLWGVRLDTSESLVDKGLQDKMGQFKPTGVVPELVCHVRDELDRYGHEDVKIIVSRRLRGGEDPQVRGGEGPGRCVRCRLELIRGANDFTADVVRIERDGEWRPCGKVGRRFIENPRLELVDG